MGEEDLGVSSLLPVVLHPCLPPHHVVPGEPVDTVLVRALGGDVERKAESFVVGKSPKLEADSRLLLVSSLKEKMSSGIHSSWKRISFHLDRPSHLTMTGWALKNEKNHKILGGPHFV